MCVSHQLARCSWWCQFIPNFFDTCINAGTWIMSDCYIKGTFLWTGRWKWININWIFALCYYQYRASLLAQTIKHLPAMWKTRVWFLGWEDPLEKEMAIHSSNLAWKIPWTEEPDRLQSMGSQKVGHDWATSLYFTFHMPEGKITGDHQS